MQTNSKGPAKKSITQGRTTKSSAPLLESFTSTRLTRAVRRPRRPIYSQTSSNSPRTSLIAGRVATVVLESCGIGVQERVIIVDEKAWEECVKSPNFRTCYYLSMAKLALQEAVAER
jgi:hypothetical protein